MSDETPKAAPQEEKQEDSVILVSYPKIVFLYPTFLVSIIAAIVMNFAAWESNTASLMGWIFLLTLTTNSVVIAFDFPRGTSLTLFFIGVVIVMGFILMGIYSPNVLPSLTGWLGSIHPKANATFFGLVAGMLGVIYGFVLLSRRFDYWEVRPNELLHHHGLLSDLKRYSAPSLRVDKEINDIFEYLLLGAGRLILHPSNEPRAIVLENVVRIGSKETAITKMLSALQVKVRTDS